VSCPACGEALTTHRERCPACGALLAPPAEGALAALPSAVTPPARGKEAPGRELGGMRKRERTWQDEVKDRVRHRRQHKSGGVELPLFTEEEPAPAFPGPTRETFAPEPDDRERPYAEPTARERGARDEPEDRETSADEAPLLSPTEGELQDLPLRPTVEESPEPPPEPVPARAHADAPPPMDEEFLGEEAPRDTPEDWLELPSKPPEARSVERPALPLERLQAAAVDLALLVTAWTVVVYFASRAAHVPLASLRPSWPWLLSYLAFLGLVYASYFTGTTGQTLGKMVTGLRVLNASSRPPGYLRSFLRAGVGALGILAAGLGQLPMMFDPARRALHDRLFGTRVVKR
jgi:uncharacterized RDD family membrane protein YckC